MAGSEASSSSNQWKYDVFLSFSGEDTRTNFTDHLFSALFQEGILTFRDEEELNRGEDISSELMAAIEDSRVAIIVFSQNYASSTWCLGELLKILHCKRHGQIEKVLPIFYNIDPSDVRKQSNTYSQAFERYEERFQNETEKVKRWRAALTEAANLKGWDQRKVADGHESELIKDIVEAVLAITNPTGGCLHVAKFPTGLDYHVDAICGLLNEGRSNAVCGSHNKRRRSDVVRTIGIYGPGGIGKTTIAKAVFNITSRNFDGSCFLANVREVSNQHQGSVRLQKQLLAVILKHEGIQIYDEHQGIITIKSRLRCKRVLIVFDDVVKMMDLDKLVGGVDWFCPGSRIMLTTRDEHLLTELDVSKKYKYKVETMDENESLQLFCHHAFKQDHPFESHEQLSKRAVHYAGGLPLALVTLGSSLYQRSPADWVYQLEKLKVIPIGDVLEKLKISYDLLDEFDRSIFLDISCFFVGEESEDKDRLSMILDACYPSGAAAIKNLKERSLVTIDEYDKLGMHDLIRDMGREIVRNECIKNPGGRSRVWNIDDAIDILRNITGTSTIEGFQLLEPSIDEAPEDFDEVTINGFSRMPNLRFLQVDWPEYARENNIDWEESRQKEVVLFKNLVSLVWCRFPLEYIPDNFHLGKLVILQMRWSSLIKVWKGTKELKMLKVLDLRTSLFLTHTPDFSGLQNLERLDLHSCLSLVKVHESIQCLKKLVELNLSYCLRLSNLPHCINGLESLEVLDVSACYVLGNLSKGFGKSKRLRKLYLSNCHCRDDDIAGCGLGELYSLESLNLSYNKFKSLPMLPSSLESLWLEHCELERLPHLSNLKQLQELDLTGCKEVIEIEGLEGLKSVTLIDLRDCQKLGTSMKKIIFQDICKEFGDGDICDIFLPGNEVPDWFGFQNDDCQVTVQLHNLEMQPQLEGVIICSTFEQPGVYCEHARFHVEVFNNSENSTWKHAKGILYDKDKRMITWVIKIPNSVWKSIAAQYEYGDTLTVSAYCVFMQWDCKTPIKRYDPDQIGLHFF